MLSHDFQRRGLKLWRGDEEKLSSTATGAFRVTAGRCCSAQPHMCDEVGQLGILRRCTVAGMSAAASSAKEDKKSAVSAGLPAQSAAGESCAPDSYVQALQGLFPAPLHPKDAAGRPGCLRSTLIRGSACCGMTQLQCCSVCRWACYLRWGRLLHGLSVCQGHACDGRMVTAS